MDRAPTKLPNTASRLIAMAVSLVGDSTEVMIAMHCSEADFHEYSDGRKEPSWPELDKLISLIVREQGIIIAKNREVLVAFAARHATNSSPCARQTNARPPRRIQSRSHF